MIEDVNKRVSRLAANIPLIRNKLCPLSFVDVPERDYIDATRSREPDLAASLQAFAEENIPPADQEAFVELARDILKRLHEGTIARYRIRPSEYEAWRNIHEPGSL